MKNDSAKYMEKRAAADAARKNVEKKKQDAILKLAKMRQLALFKANLVTQTLLVSLSDKFILLLALRLQKRVALTFLCNCEY